MNDADRSPTLATEILRAAAEPQGLTIERLLGLAACRVAVEKVAVNDTASSRQSFLCADSLKLEWNVETGVVGIFVRSPDGRDLSNPSVVFKLDEWLDHVEASDRVRLQARLQSLAHSLTRSFEMQVRMKEPGGRRRWVDLTGIAVRDTEGRLLRVIAQQTMLATDGDCGRSSLPSPFHDALTGLPNRWLFDRCLGDAFAAVRQDGVARFAVLFIDLDNFKQINDRYGHLIGDRVLVAVAERFSHSLRPMDVLARRGGDEFTVLVRDIDRLADAAAVAERILAQLSTPLALDGIELLVAASVGVAIVGPGIAEASDLLRAADRAMYRAKAVCGNCCMPSEIESVHAA